MKEQYGDYELRYDETREKFEAFKGEERIASSAKLSDLKKRLDRVSVVREKFNRYTVLSFSSGGKFTDEDMGTIEWTVTSVVSGSEVWMTGKDGSRRKEDLARGYNKFYADTPENRAALIVIADLCKKRDRLSKQIEMDLNLVKRASVPANVETEAGNV